MQQSFQSPLNEAEEKYYVERLIQGSTQARDILIQRNMRLVAHIAKKYQNTDEEMEELISIGVIGLIKAVSSFCPDRGSRLGTYAARCIENEMLMYFRNRKKTARDVSLYEPVGTDRDGNQIQIVDLVESPEGELFERVMLKKGMAQLYRLIPTVLNERERYIIIERYGLYNRVPRTQKQIADHLGISRSYVSRIQKKAIQKLKKAFDLC